MTHTSITTPAWPECVSVSDPRIHFADGSGYGYGTVPGGRWAIDTEGGHVVVSVSLIRNGYEYGRRSRGRFRIPHAILAICL